MVKGTGRKFMEKTKYKYLEKSDQVKGLPQPPLALSPAKDKPVHRLPDPREVLGEPWTSGTLSTTV